MTEVILCDFWNCHKRWKKLPPGVPSLSLSLLSLSAHPWNPAARLAGSPGHMEKIPEGVSANRLPFGTDQQPPYTTARHVSEEALKANSIHCSSNCSYVRDPRQEPSSWAQWISSIMRNNNKWLFLFCTMKFEMVYFGAIDIWNRDQVAKWFAYGYTAVGLQILKVSCHLVNVDLHFFFLHLIYLLKKRNHVCMDGCS